jgi:copper chaperone CopZ
MTKEMEKKNNANIYSAVTLAISGMHCESCVGRVETALLRLAGVVDTEVDLAEHKAEISFDSEKVSVDDLKASVEAEGYHILDENKKGADLGMNTLTADWYFARVQFSEYRWWILTLAIGFGIQVTLFTLFRAQLRGQKMRAVKSSVAASGGMSATAMMACCSHYLAAVIPALGVPFLSATAVARLAEYQTYFFLAGVISCLVGIGLILRMMEKHGMIRNPILKNFFTFRMARIRGSG